MAKIKLLHSVNDIIMEEIETFWAGLNVKDKLTIAADQIILIYLYIVIRSKIPEFFSHLRFIQDFTTDYVKKISFGFYLATYERALYQLVESDEDSLGRIISMPKSLPQTPITRPRMKKNFVGTMAIGTVLKQAENPFESFAPQ